MKTKIALIMLSFLLVFTPEAGARFGAIAYSTGEESFGVVGLTWNWRTRSSAISGAIREARDLNGGFLDGFRTYWWSPRGYNTAARGFSEDGEEVKFGWSYGWRTINGSVNSAMRRGDRFIYPVDRGYVFGFNR
jgi:hypothetical protein